METMAQRWEKRGKIEGKRETALELYKIGVDINIIVKSTGLTREEVEKMAETVH